MKKRIIIIGAGLGGLTAGNLLAAKGYDVKIFEAHTIPGGYTSGFWKKGYYFESGAIGISNAEAIFPLLKKMGVFNDIHLKKHELFRFHSSYFDGIPESYDQLKKMVIDAFPNNRALINNYFLKLDKLHNTFIGFIGTSSIINKFISALKFMYYLIIYKGITAKDFVARHIPKNTPAYNLLSYMIGFPNLPAAFIGAYFGGIFKSYWCVEEGMLFWSNKLSKKFKNNGGNILYNSKVQKILIKNGRAFGVEVNNQKYEADFVISACDYKQTFLKLTDRKYISDKFYNKLTTTPVSEGWFISYVGLNVSNSKLREYLKTSHLHGYDLNSNIENLTDSEKSIDADYFKHCRYEVYSPSLENAKLSPYNKSSLMVMAFAPSQWLNNWGDKNREEYDKLKLKAQKDLINRINSVIPNIEESIEFIESATPLTFKRYTQNSDGAVCSWGFRTKDRFYKSDVSVNVKTPIKNLYMGSSWACQIGATYLAMKAGEKCAKVIG